MTLNGMGPIEKSMKVEEGRIGNVLSTPVLQDASACAGAERDDDTRMCADNDTSDTTAAHLQIHHSIGQHRHVLEASLQRHNLKEKLTIST